MPTKKAAEPYAFYMEQRPSGEAAVIITHFLLVGGDHPKLVDLFATNRQQVSVDSGGGLYVTQPADILRIRLGLTVMVLVVIASYGRWPPDYSTGPVVFFLEGNFFLPCCMRPYRAIAGPERM